MKLLIISLLIIGSVMGAFFSYYRCGPFTPATSASSRLVDVCEVCGQLMYDEEELDYFITSWIGDMPYMIPVYKTVPHRCKSNR
jgi:hypothetical protein